MTIPLSPDHHAAVRTQTPQPSQALTPAQSMLQNLANTFHNPRVNNSPQNDALVLSATFFQVPPKDWDPKKQRTLQSQQSKSSDSATGRQKETETEEAIQEKNPTDQDSDDQEKDR